MNQQQRLFGGNAILLLPAAVLVLDQAIKLAAKHYLNLHHSHRVIGHFLRLTLVENVGMAFSLQFGKPAFFSIFGVLAVVVVFILLLRLRQARFITRLALALLLGGAAGNLTDRFAYGGVIDFIEMDLGVMTLPVFNLADAAVTLGLVMLVLAVFVDREAPAPESNLREAFPPKAKAGTTDEEKTWSDVRSTTKQTGTEAARRKS